MLYHIGDVLICTKKVNTKCLEMSNPEFEIMPDDKYIVTDKDDFPDENECHWYELTSVNDNLVFLNAWNDEGHMIIDESFTLEKC